MGRGRSRRESERCGGGASGLSCERATGRARARKREPAARVLLVLFLCAGIATLGLLGGGEHKLAGARRGSDPMAGFFGPDMPRYPGGEEAPAGTESSLGAATMKLSTLQTEDEPLKVGRFYANFWRQRRFFVREDVTHMGGVVSAVDVHGGFIYQLLLSVQGGRTLGFPSQTRSPLAASRTEGAVPPVPLYPESQTTLAFGSGEKDKRARLHLSVNDGGLEANLAHYRRELKNAGYSEETGAKQPEALGPDHRILVFKKEGSEVTVNLALLGGRRVRVHLMLVES